MSTAPDNSPPPPYQRTSEPFSARAGGSAITETVHDWQWFGTFGRWSALVTFAYGWQGFTYPTPTRVSDPPLPDDTECSQPEDASIERVCTEATGQERNPAEYEQQRLF